MVPSFETSDTLTGTKTVWYLERADTHINETELRTRRELHKEAKLTFEKVQRQFSEVTRAFLINHWSDYTGTHKKNEPCTQSHLLLENQLQLDNGLKNKI